MTSRALGIYEADVFDGAVLDETYAGFFKAATIPEDGFGDISRAEGLKGARAAMTAIGIEAAAAFCVYGVWLLLRSR